MGLIHEIQNAVMAEGSQLAPLLLKLRFLAAKLGSHPLAEWVKYEAEGYPDDVEVPDYRKLNISYKGTFSGPFGSSIQNAPIPPYLIQEFAGDGWNIFKFRQSIAAVDSLISGAGGEGTLTINSSNLGLILQGKVYPDYSCIGMTGILSVAQLSEIQHVVRNRILELVLEIEASVPSAGEISTSETIHASPEEAGKVTQIFNQTIHGNMSNVANTGTIGTINVVLASGNTQAVAEYLEKAGISKSDAQEFAALLQEEKPESKEEPFGKKARTWIADNLKKAANGTWKAGVSVATDVLKHAALAYYGLS